MAEEQYEVSVCDCGHAVEAHSDANGCELCDCSETHGRNYSGGGDGASATVEAPVAEGGAAGV